MRNRKATAGAITIMLFGIMVMFSCTHKPQQTIPKVSFSGDIVPIFEASCAFNGSCHLGANNGNDEINLGSSDAYASIVAKRLVSTANPAASLLYVEVNSGIMPKAPYPPLSQAQITTILNWIKQGALNN